MPSRRHLLALAAAGIAALPLGALAQAADPAIARIQALYDAFRAVLTIPKEERDRRIEALGTALGDAFDFGAMARLAVGPAAWGKLPPEKQAGVQDAFKAYVTAVWTSRFLGVSSDERFEVMPSSDARPGGRLVRTKVYDPAGTFDVNFLVGPQGKVVDSYLAATVSEAARMRPEFEALLKSGGADALEASLRDRAVKALTPP